MIEKFLQEKLNYSEDLDKFAKLYMIRIIDCKYDPISVYSDSKDNMI